MRPVLLAVLGFALLVAAPAGALAQSGRVLVDAAGQGDLATVRKQIKRGAPVEARDARGWTALMVASSRGHLEVVRVLLREGADPSPRAVDGSTPLMAAAVGGHMAIVSALLDAGADPSLRNQAGATARSKAIEYGHRDVASLLEARSPAAAEPSATATASPGATSPLDLASFDVEDIDEVHILARDANLRNRPSLAAPVVAQLPRGVELRVTGRVVDRPWYRVGPAERAVYVESDALSGSSPQAPTP